MPFFNVLGLIKTTHSERPPIAKRNKPNAGARTRFLSDPGEFQKRQVRDVGAPRASRIRAISQPNNEIQEPKLRIFARHKKIAIKKEVDKLLSTGIIKESSYTTWLANVVMVKKANGKGKMCVDFTDLNVACPKDSYPLPRIYKLVDSIAGHATLSFLDAYSVYHQIGMREDDIEKTAFQAAGGVYCYTKLPFGMKNAGATYQGMVNKVCASQTGRNMEAYIDDMVIKIKSGRHVVDLKETSPIYEQTTGNGTLASVYLDWL